MNLERRQRDPGREPMRVPRYLPGADGLVGVDPTWGTIQPIELAPGVETVGELEVIEQLRAGLPLVDTRLERSRRQATIPGSLGIPQAAIIDRVDELDPGRPTVLFCNGPQCAATPRAVRALLEHGYPAAALRYYRGGILDWMALGLPIEGVRASPASG